MERSGFYHLDEFGVKNYHLKALLITSILTMVMLCTGLGYLTYLFEVGAEGANVTNYAEAVWLMLMSASTIGFGDFYPVTLGGRIVSVVMFSLGVGILGGIGAMFATRMFGFSDTNVKNRELRKQNAEILEKVTALEAKLDRLLQQKQ
ncbi:two pore domain potassium channel family protein [Ferrimonas lipolytica]|uniref:Two pore domain potassium channel family protein n=1 Tax=Ferrimonas lipolytica TaxID=2724191 RepID=A0A6H1UL02_9GAMM|nr:two pore domain potassium channel family protein [Ferrimonas lipolytica]